MSEEDLKSIPIGGPGLSDAAYALPKTPLGRQSPLRTATVRVFEREVRRLSTGTPPSGTVSSASGRGSGSATS